MQVVDRKIGDEAQHHMDGVRLRWCARSGRGIGRLPSYSITGPCRGVTRGRAGLCSHNSAPRIGRGLPPAGIEIAVKISLVVDDDSAELAVGGRVAAHAPFGERALRNA